ncbi:serine/threonine-protein kinase WNK-like isoform X2 [Sycon ciliatum]|uniref:serine/threonine-protein kinase WNK-like isoform X2 n=1 Tax=Sycon ciliatum TaxID=27933 RepID=UPI0031F6FC56
MATSTPEAALLRDLGLGRGEIAYHGIFTVEDQIGRGSDADVYRVVWQGIPVAAKVFHPRHDQADVEGRDKNLRRFGAEIARLSQLNHPNLCQVLGVAVTADRHLPVLVVELFDHTLCQCSVGADRFDHVALLSFLADAVAGVRYLHSRDPPVIHRDLTLRNVLIKGQIAKLCDFGCARLRPTSPADLVGFLPDLTACPGNVLYMAPEALQNPPVYDESLDIFSFGVLATSVVTGVEPSTDMHTSPRTIIRQVERADGTSEETVTAITEVERRVVDLERIPDGHPLKPAIFRCLAVVAEDRPKAEELHEIVLDTVKVARGLSPPHLSNVPPAVLRRLDSISEQLTQQATSITAMSARSDTLEKQLTAAITNNQTTTQQQLTATSEQVSTIQDEQSSATQRHTEHLEAIAENQTMMKEQLTATQHTIHNEQTTTNRRVHTLADQLRDMNEQTSRRMTTLTDQISAVSGQLTTMSASIHQLQIRPTTAPKSLSSSASPTASVTTAVVPVSSSIAAQDSRSSLAPATEPAPASPTATTVRPSTAPESLSSSASATASAGVPISIPIAAQDSQSSSASATGPAVTGSPAATIAQATRAASTAVSSVDRGYHVLPAMPTPKQIANIRIRRKWNKSEVQQHSKHAMLATYSEKLVAVWYDGVTITKIMQTSDLQTWHSIDLPSEYSKLADPSLASHGGMLYMYCNTYTKSTKTGVRSLLQYRDTPDIGDGGGGGQWTTVTDVSHCNHDWCTLHVCHDAISLYGGYDGDTDHNHVSTYSLASQQRSSSSSSNTSLVLPSLPLPCSSASLVPFPDSLYLVGGVTGCFLKHHDGRWVSASPPDGVELEFSAACALSDHCMVICPSISPAECVVYDISSGLVYPVPATPEYSSFTPSLTLFCSTLVLSVSGLDNPGSLYTLDMSV